MPWQREALRSSHEAPISPPPLVLFLFSLLVCIPTPSTHRSISVSSAGLPAHHRVTPVAALSYLHLFFFIFSVFRGACPAVFAGVFITVGAAHLLAMCCGCRLGGAGCVCADSWCAQAVGNAQADGCAQGDSRSMCMSQPPSSGCSQLVRRSAADTSGAICPSSRREAEACDIDQILDIVVQCTKIHICPLMSPL